MSDQPKNIELTKAIIEVMKEIKGVEKNTQVGKASNSSSYKGVSDQDVKEVVQASMAKHGLCILPIDVEPNTKIRRWEEEKIWNGKSEGMKMKQSVFVEVKTKYLLMHVSGESQVICGAGHGNDPMDKAIGKATTYALKYALLYTFLIPTGTIDDSDNTHSNEQEVPKKKKENQKPQQKKELPVLVKGSEDWIKIERFHNQGVLKSLAQITKMFTVDEVLQAEILKMIKSPADFPKNEDQKQNLSKDQYDKAMRMRTPEKIQELLDNYEMEDDARRGLQSKLDQLNGKDTTSAS